MGFKGMIGKEDGHRGWERRDQVGLLLGRPCKKRQLVWLSLG